MVSTTSGARLGTVTVKPCCAESPPGSLAVTVTFEVPCAPAVTVSEAPETATVATPAFELEAAKVNAPPSGSLK